MQQININTVCVAVLKTKRLYLIPHKKIDEHSLFHELELTLQMAMKQNLNVMTFILNYSTCVSRLLMRRRHEILCSHILNSLWNKNAALSKGRCHIRIFAMMFMGHWYAASLKYDAIHSVCYLQSMCSVAYNHFLPHPLDVLLGEKYSLK